MGSNFKMTVLFNTLAWSDYSHFGWTAKPNLSHNPALPSSGLDGKSISSKATLVGSLGGTNIGEH